MTTPPPPAWPLSPLPQRIDACAGQVALPASLDAAALWASLLDALGTDISRTPAGCDGWLSITISGAACGSDFASRAGYQLRIDPSQRPPVSILASTPHGARHALATLAQLLLAFPRALPACHVRDWPAIEHRGVMLDISRNRVPTMAHLAKLVKLLALWKVNHLQLYIEHTFAYAGHEQAWQGSSPITPQELTQLDALCHAHGITLAANQNCFGHLAHWLRLPAYAHLAETQGDWMFDVWPRSGPFSLCPTDPRSARLVRDLLTQQCACVQGSLVNVGCDEVYDIAFGRSKDEVAQRGRLAVFADFVRQITDITHELGKRPMLWADIVLSHASDPAAQPQLQQLLAHLRDRRAVLLPWWYEGDADFAGWLARIHAAGLEAWACPGTSCWRSLTGRTRERRENLARAIHAVRSQRGSGVLVCAWGDVGHWQQWPITLHALGEACGACWTGMTPPAHQPAEHTAEQPSPQHARTTHAVFSDAHATSPAHASLFLDAQRVQAQAQWLDALGDADEPLRRVAGPLSRPDRTVLPNATAIFASLHAQPQALTLLGHAPLWHEACQRLLALSRTLPAGGPFEAELSWTLRLSAFAVMRALRTLGHVPPAGARSAWPHATLGELLRSVRDEHAALWLRTSRPGGLDESMRHYDTILRNTPASVLESTP